MLFSLKKTADTPEVIEFSYGTDDWEATELHLNEGKVLVKEGVLYVLPKQPADGKEMAEMPNYLLARIAFEIVSNLHYNLEVGERFPNKLSIAEGRSIKINKDDNTSSIFYRMCPVTANVFFSKGTNSWMYAIGPQIDLNFFNYEDPSVDHILEEEVRRCASAPAMKSYMGRVAFGFKKSGLYKPLTVRFIGLEQTPELAAYAAFALTVSKEFWDNLDSVYPSEVERVFRDPNEFYLVCKHLKPILIEKGKSLPEVLRMV